VCWKTDINVNVAFAHSCSCTCTSLVSWAEAVVLLVVMLVSEAMEVWITVLGMFPSGRGRKVRVIRRHHEKTQQLLCGDLLLVVLLLLLLLMVVVMMAVVVRCASSLRSLQ
jgi:hypothetical protein